MKVKPIERYNSPGFPTRSILDERPELLRLVPKRWQKNPVVIAALAATAVLVGNACSAAQQGGGKSTASRVAPIFKHGSGRGTFAGKTLTPPMSLSEGEARQIVVEEAKRAGITLSPDSRTVEVGLPKGYNKQRKLVKTSIKLDGTDTRRSISYEYVSEADVRQWNTSMMWPMGTAQSLRNGLKTAGPAGVYAVFYDPTDRGPVVMNKKGQFDSAGYKKKALAACRQDLRAQVRDFIKWLKGQGVI